MNEVEIRSQAGDVVGRMPLNPSLFGAQVNVPVMHQVVRAQLAAARAGTHATKSRGEVAGGGKKPWRQKGTGRSRQGSIRAPHWAGGGVAMGPKPGAEDVKVPKKMRALALRSALSDRARGGRIAVVERFDLAEPKTKDAIKALEALEVSGKALIVLEGRDEAVGKSFRNLEETRVITVDQLNTYDVLAADWVVFTRTALERLSQRTGSGSVAEPREADRRSSSAEGGDLA